MRDYTPSTSDGIAVKVLAYEIHCPECHEPLMMPAEPHAIMWCPEQDEPYPEEVRCLCGEMLAIPLPILAAQPNRPDHAALHQRLLEQEFGWDAPTFDPEA